MTLKLFNSLSFRLLLGFLVPLVLFLAAAAVSYFAVQRLLRALEREQASQKTLAEIYDMKESLKAMASAKRAHHLTGNDQFKKTFEDNRKGFHTDVQSLRQTTQDDKALTAKINAISKMSAKWLNNAESSFDLWKNRSEFAKKDNFLDWFLKWDEMLNLNTGVILLQDLDRKIEELETGVQANFDRHREEVFSQTKESTWAILVALVVSIGLGISATQILSGTVVRPVNQLKEALSEMRQGNFEAITPYGPNEIAELIRGFNLMGISLAERTMVLETSELRYRTVVGTTSQMLWTTDATGANVDMTDWRTFTGQTLEDLVDDGWLKAIHPDDVERFVTNWQEALIQKRYAVDEFRIRRADGVFRDFACRSIPIFDNEEEVREWVRVCVDITERKEQEEMRRQRDAADAANRAKSEFLAKMSHELRTPLNAIIGMTKMLSTQRFGQLNEKQLDYLSDVTQAGEHLLDLINDILDLSKVEAGRLELHPEPISVGATIDNVVSTVRTLAESKNLDVHSELPDEDGHIRADLSRFKQILYNLISNAVKFTPNGGKVIVRANWVLGAHQAAPLASRDDAKGLRVDVEDTGIGLSKKDQEKLGTEFFQAETDLTNAQEGTGLGVALSQRLARVLGGELWFTSEKGVGSTFSVALPVEPVDGLEDTFILSEEPQQRFHREPGAEDKRPLALIIDDHKPTNKLMADWLDEAEIDAVSAFDGKSGLNAARRHRPQLILLDVRLPDISGFDVLNQLKNDSDTRDIPIVMVTVLEGQSQPRELDIVDWFVKPLDKGKIMKRLEKAVPGLFTNGHAILIVDDDEAARHAARKILAGSGFAVMEAASSEDALKRISEKTPDLVMLNLFLGKTKGIPFIRNFREKPDCRELPIIVVTDEKLSKEHAELLNGNIQSILREDLLSAEKLAERVRQLL